MFQLFQQGITYNLINLNSIHEDKNTKTALIRLNSYQKSHVIFHLHISHHEIKLMFFCNWIE